MSEEEEFNIEDFETTALIRIKPSEAKLPIDTATEWTKGFMLINKLIKELADVRYTEEFIDGSGKKRQRMMLHPQLLGYLQERRKMIDQIWKISGGELVKEGQKEMIKNFAKFIFETQMDDKMKKKYRDHVINIIEVETNEND